MTEFLHAVDSELYAGSLTRPVEAVATDMKLVRGPSEYRKPVNVGLMFFNESPEDFFPYSQIEVVIKPDPTGIGMRERTFKGPLDKQLRDALTYIRNSVIEEYVTKVPDQAEAVRVFNWPYRAVEEALSNAIYHRSYQIHEPVTVTVTPETMDILSIPGPDVSISDEDLANRVLISSRYRNRRIGDFLKELKLVEGRNTGIPLIINAMRQNGSALPEFKTDEGRSYFRVILPIHPVFLQEEEHAEQPVRTERRRVSRRTKNELRQLITVALRQNDLSMRELSAQLGYAKLTDSVRLVVKEMIENGEAEYLYPDKTNNPNQKIRLK
jgi:ATP-dependent DNA helicase RecG